MEIKIGGNPYRVIDTKDKVTIPDCFVVRQNKIGHGNGEAKLYVGNDSKEIRSFFGTLGFVLKCFLLKKDLIKYLNETKTEYLKPEQPYLNKSLLPRLWEKRKELIDKLPEIIIFEVVEQIQIAGPRIYINSNDHAYKIIRELSLPNITYISIVKLFGPDGNISFYFRLFADYFGEVEHPYVLEAENNNIEKVIKDDEIKTQIIKARIGQGEYRKKLLELCPFCPITLISDDRLLIASHIKPWAVCGMEEKTDPYNGFMLTPMFDYLFDRGFLSFTDSKKTILSPFLSKMTYSKIGISDDKIIPHLPTEGRESYLEYHRVNILKS